MIKGKENVSMEIAMVFDGLQVGGIERVGADYANLLVSLGHKVTVFNLRPKLTDMEKEFLSKCTITHINFPRKFAPEQYAQLIKYNYIGKLLYPILYTGITILNSIYKIICYRNHLSRKRYDLIIAFSGHFNDLTFVSSNFLKAKKKMCWLHGALYGYLLISDGYFNLYKKIKNLVVLIDDAQDEVLITNRNPHLNIYKLYNPTFIKNRIVNEQIVKELQQKYGRFLIMVSRFEYPHKDQFTVANALKICRETYGDNINLLFLGNGPDEKRVKEHVMTLGEEIKKHIFFMGNQNEVQNYYSAACMLVHASIAGEGLPTVMLEALAYNLPMVVTDSKIGPREILGNDEYGLLCKVKDSEDMAQKIHQLLTNKDLYKYYKNNSKKRLKAFEADTIQIQLKNILDNVMSQ